jgi:hypothetical protein
MNVLPDAGPTQRRRPGAGYRPGGGRRVLRPAERDKVPAGGGRAGSRWVRLALAAGALSRVKPRSPPAGRLWLALSAATAATAAAVALL